MLAALAAITVAAALVPMAMAGDGNHGTVKVHDDADATPDQKNEPHVGCDFYVEGFKMEAESGTLTFFSWSPTGDKSQVMSSGWNGTAEEDGHGFHFLEGPFNLTSGHYRIEATDKDDHTKNKMFWVDCGPTPTDTETASASPTPGGTESATPTASVPVFPTPVTMGLGVVLSSVAAFAVLRTRRV